MKEYSNFLLSFSSLLLNCSKSIITGSAQSSFACSSRRRRQNCFLSSPLLVLLLLLPLSSFTCLFVLAEENTDKFESFREMLEKSNNKHQAKKTTTSNDNDKNGFDPSSAVQKKHAKQEESNQATNLFKEYITRGMYSCTSHYVHTIAKLHALIKDAYEDYASCQKKMKDTSKSFTPTEFDVLNELLEEWDEQKDKLTTPLPLLDKTQPSTSSSHMTRVDILPASIAPLTMETQEGKEDQTLTSKRERRSQKFSSHHFLI